MKSFVIQCLTCQSKLQVQGASLLGTIINCPSCQSMVEVPDVPPDPDPGAAPPESESSRWQSVGKEVPPPRVQQEGNETVEDFGYEHDSMSGEDGSDSDSSDVVYFSSQAGQEATSLEDTSQDHQLPTPDTWVSEKTQRRSRQALLVGGAVTLVLLLVTSFIYFSQTGDSPRSSATVPPELDNEPKDPVDDSRVDPESGEEPEPVKPEEVVEENPAPAIEPQPGLLEPSQDPPPAVDPEPTDPPGLVAEQGGEEATTDDLAGALRQFGNALGAQRPAPVEMRSDDDVDPVETVQPDRIPIAVGDVEAALAFPIADFEMAEPMSFLDFTEMFSRIGNFPITLDLDALAASTLDLETRVQLVRKETTIEDVLRLITSPHQLALAPRDGHLLIGWPEDARTRLVEVQYKISGGVPGTTHTLEELLREMVSPESWQGMEGAAMPSMELEEDLLTVRQTLQVHHHLRILLERLHAARSQDPTDLKKLPRVAAAAEKLAQPISLNFSREIPLAVILHRLGQEAKMNILVDWVATYPAGWGPSSPTTLVADRNPLSQVLTIFLDSMNLDYRIVDNRTIQISTPEHLVARDEIELHAISALLEEKPAVDIVTQIQAILGRESTAGIIVDMPSQHLVLRASQADQVRIHHWLNPQP